MKKFIFLALLLVGMLSFTACNYEMEFTINTDGSCEYSVNQWYSIEDIKNIMKYMVLIPGEGVSVSEEQQAALEANIAELLAITTDEELKAFCEKNGSIDAYNNLVKKEIDGEIHYSQSDMETINMSAEEVGMVFGSSGILFDGDSFVFDTETLIKNSDSIVEQYLTSEESIQEYKASLSTITYQIKVTMPEKIVITNGELSEDKKSVSFKVNLGEKAKKYYVFTDGSDDIIRLEGINGGYYKKKSLKIYTFDKIESLKVNGKAVTGKKIDTSKDGKYEVVIKTALSEKTVEFTKDSTKPVVKGVKDGETYTGSVKIKFSDKTSGIKSAKLGKKRITSGTKITKPGEYTLKVTDNAGNKTTVKFTIAE